MAKSDVLEVCDSPGVSVGRNMATDGEDDPFNDHTIHSGHFMVSRVHGAQLEEDDEDSQDDNIAGNNPGYDFESAPKEPAATYQFGDTVVESPMSLGTIPQQHSRFIDSSLTKLFECMTLAYSGKLTSPKWKNFKGVKLPLKDKIRLNNIIWREWHMQFIQGQRPIVCQFDPPISDKTHSKAEAIVLEGKYWKRRLESVTAEYKKWRIFYKNHFNRFPDDMSQMMEEVASHAELLDRLVNTDGGRLASSFSALLQESMEEDFSMDFSDTLFTTLNQPFAFPNPKELGQLGNADIIQPGLIQLQPSFDEFMDTLEPLPSLSEMFGAYSRGHHFSQDSTMTDSYSSLHDSDLMLSNQMGSYEQTMNNAQQAMPSPQPMNTTTTLLTDNRSAHVINNSDLQILSSPQQTQQLIVSSSLPSSSDILHQTTSISSPQIINLVLSTSDINQAPQLAQQQPLLSSKPTTFTLLSPLQSLLQGGEPNTIMTNQQQQQQQQPQQIAPQPLLPSTTTINYEDLNQPKGASVNILRQTHQSDSSLLNKKRESEARRASTGSVSTYKTIVPKTKEGPFVIPQTPVGPRPKGPRNLAPASSSSSNPKTPLQKKNTFLAQLLTQELLSSLVGNCSSGGNAVKSEKQSGVSSTCHMMNSTTTNRKIASASNQQSSSGTDFQKNILMASASEAPGSSAQKPIEVMQTSSLNDWNESVTGAHSAPPSPSTCGPLSPAVSIPSPASDGGSTPNKPFRPKNDVERKLYNEHRRASHITAEQKRRCNIRVGFETLHQIVPALAQNPNTKISKAATLQKTADYLAKLKVERSQMQEEQEVLRKEIDSLNASISVCQSQLPATGVPVTRQRFDQMREMFDDYVRDRTLQNWKFWIFSIIIRPLFDSFNNSVSTASADELCRTVLTWLDQNCSLVALRPGVLNSLRTLSISTSILSDPSKVPEQATEAVTRGRLPPQAGRSSHS